MTSVTLLLDGIMPRDATAESSIAEAIVEMRNKHRLLVCERMAWPWSSASYAFSLGACGLLVGDSLKAMQG